MSKFSFVKYQAAGNDFILIDDRTPCFDPVHVFRFCHRNFGIGADGVILLQDDWIADFRMRIFNCDGSEAESCGNGLRCLMQFLLHLGLPKRKYRIATGSRIVEAGFIGDRIAVQMGPPRHVKQLYIEGHEVFALDTGVPHVVIFVPDVEKIDLSVLGPFFRHHALFQPQGTNVNFASLQDNGSICVRTYERGLERECMACGTGAAAVGAIASQKYRLPSPIRMIFRGGEVGIQVHSEGVEMVGQAIRVFEGTVNI